MIAQFVYQPVLGFLWRDLERLVEGSIGRLHAQLSVKNQQGFAHGFDNGLSKNLRFTDSRRSLLAVGHVADDGRDENPVLGQSVVFFVVERFGQCQNEKPFRQRNRRVRQSRQFEFDEALVLAHQDVIDLLLDEQADSLAELAEDTGKSIRLQTESLYLQDQFDVVLM